jgi:hypothetical protein
MSRVTGHVTLCIAEDLGTGEAIVRTRLRPAVQGVRKPTRERQAHQKPKSPPPILPHSHN